MANRKKAKAKPQAKRKQALGKGLSSLLGAAAGSIAESFEQTIERKPAPGDTAPSRSAAAGSEAVVAVAMLHPGPWQPRRNFDEAALNELTDSVKARGVVQPLLVRPRPGMAGQYEIIAGERRWRAAQRASLHDVPVFIRDFGDAQAAEIALIENIQRRDLNAIEEAAGYEKLMGQFGYTQKRLAEIVGKSRSHLANSMRLLTLPLDVQDMVAAGELTAGQARPLIGRDGASSLAREIIAKNMSARQVEALVARLARHGGGDGKAQGGRRGGQAVRDANLAALEKQLGKSLGVVARLRYNEKTGQGRITLEPKTLEQFETILAKLK